MVYTEESARKRIFLLMTVVVTIFKKTHIKECKIVPIHG